MRRASRGNARTSDRDDPSHSSRLSDTDAVCKFLYILSKPLSGCPAPCVKLRARYGGARLHSPPQCLAPSDPLDPPPYLLGGAAASRYQRLGWMFLPRALSGNIPRNPPHPSYRLAHVAAAVNDRNSARDATIQDHNGRSGQ